MRDPTDVLPPYTSKLGRWLRLPLRLIPHGMVLPILAGPARGMKWIAGSGPHSNWLGINEINKRRRFVELVRPGSVIYDIGANVGSYSMLASKLAGPTGRVVAIEPSPANLAYLKQHIELNGLQNVDVLACALADRVGTTGFQETADRVTSHVAEDGCVRVECSTMDALVNDRGEPVPHVLKIDVEGAEASVLRGAARTLARVRPLIFLATHGIAVRDECFALLEGARYRIEPIRGLEDEFVASPA